MDAIEGTPPHIMPPASEPLTEWIDAAGPEGAAVEQAWQRWVLPLSFVVCPVLMGGVLLIAALAPLAGLILALCVALIGLALTLLAMGWGAMIVFADSARKGMWFAIFPPYMVYYAAAHWSVMARPSLLFLCGCVLTFGTLFGVQWMTSDRAAQPHPVVDEERELPSRLNRYE